MRARWVFVVAVVLVAVGCGGGSSDSVSGDAADGGGVDDESPADADVDGGAGDGDGGAGDGEGGSNAGSAAPAEMNTIRVGGEVWARTLPMTTGQCFVQNVDGLPESGTAWGTLDGDDDLRFSASYNQDGTTEAEVQGPNTFLFAGARVADGPDDLVVELDFEALTITGAGTFTDIATGEELPGSFAFQCEDDGSGG